jgi:hypothetical protein
MALYKITWKSVRYGQSGVEAESIEEARKKADNEEDFDFEEYEDFFSWDIADIEEVPTE